MVSEATQEHSHSTYAHKVQHLFMQRSADMDFKMPRPEGLSNKIGVNAALHVLHFSNHCKACDTRHCITAD